MSPLKRHFPSTDSIIAILSKETGYQKRPRKRFKLVMNENGNLRQEIALLCDKPA